MERKITLLRLVVFSFFLFVLQPVAYGQVYKHEFGTTPISTHPYTVTPSVLNTYLSGSSWSNSNAAWTSFSGSAGQAISMAETGGTKTITLTLTVAAGRQLAVTGYNFWRQRSNTGAQNWSMAINGTTVGTGNFPPAGAPLSTTDPIAVSSPISGLTGTVNVVLTLTGASGTGNVRLDDFALFGSVTQNCTPPVISSVSPLSGPAGTVVTINGTGFQVGTGTSSVTFNGTAAIGFTVVSDTQIKAIVPATATTGTVMVTTNSCEGTTPVFTVLESTCPVVNPPNDIFISELFDQNGGTPGAIELYNPTPNTITFNGQYVLERYGTIGDPLPDSNYILTLTGSIAPNSTYLLSSGDIPCGITPVTGFGGGINASDEFKLKKNNIVIDVAQAPGEIGYTVKRNPDAPVPSANFNAADWTFLSNEDCSNLGIHTINSSLLTRITAQPLSAAICEGESVTYSVTLENATGVTYQWKMVNASGIWVNITNNSVFSGATTANLTITNAPLDLNSTQFYCQVVTTASCNLISNSVQLTVSPLPVVIIAKIDPTCTTNTGSIVIIPSVGDGLTYSLNGTTYQTNPLFGTMAPGNYTLYVKSSANCITEIPFTIAPVPTAPAVAIATPTQPGCGQSTGTITVTAPLGTEYTYSINGTDFQASPVFTAAPGSYFITVQNVSGCTSVTTSATVINPIPVAPAIATVAAPVQPTCAVATGTITITAPLGTGLTYSINGTDFQASPVFTAAPGSYFITVKNADGCTSITTTATVINPVTTAPAVATVAAPVQPTCAVATGTITITAPLGAGLTYSINGTDFQSSPVFTAAPGSYFITVKNADGCTSITTTATVINPVTTAPAVANVAAPVQPTCAVVTGTITITTPLGAGLTYSINGTDFQASPVFIAAPGSYFITVKNADGCTSITTTATVINPIPVAPAIATIAAPVQPTCAVATGTITITAPLGTGLTYSINGTDFQASPVFTAAPGSYFITVKNADGCTSITTTATVINPVTTAPAVATVAAPVQPTCAVATGTITITAPLGTGLTYSINGTDFQSSPVFTAAPGSYFITVKNADGCTSITTTATVINPVTTTPAVATVAAPVQPTCAVATGTITITAPLGTGLTYSINGTDFQSSPVFTAAPGSYFITVKNADGCTSVTTTATVINPVPVAPPVAITALTPATCNTKGSITVTSPVGAQYTYSINGTFQASPVFNGLDAGNYIVTVMGTGGCTSQTGTLTITETGGTISIAASEGCEETIGGKHYILHALPQNGSFNENDADYEWRDANGTIVSQESSFDATAYANSNQVNVEDYPLQFTVTVTTPGGCSGTALYTVNGTFCDIPKGISPNNDGLNDNFDISGLNARKLSIYNRYGQEVYTRSNYTNEWFGQSESGDLTSGTYYYVIELPNGTKTGWVYLNKEEN